MGQDQSRGGAGKDKGKQDDKDKKKKYEPPIPTRVGKKAKKHKGTDHSHKLPAITPHRNCRLKLLKLNRVNDFLLMEEEFIQNQVGFSRPRRTLSIFPESGTLNNVSTCYC